FDCARVPALRIGAVAPRGFLPCRREAVDYEAALVFRERGARVLSEPPLDRLLKERQARVAAAVAQGERRVAGSELRRDAVGELAALDRQVGARARAIPGFPAAERVVRLVRQLDAERVPQMKAQADDVAFRGIDTVVVNVEHRLRREALALGHSLQPLA